MVKARFARHGILLVFYWFHWIVAGPAGVPNLKPGLGQFHLIPY